MAYAVAPKAVWRSLSFPFFPSGMASLSLRPDSCLIYLFQDVIPFINLGSSHCHAVWFRLQRRPFLTQLLKIEIRLRAKEMSFLNVEEPLNHSLNHT